MNVVAAHEFGHTAGLNDLDELGTDFTGYLMNAHKLKQGTADASIPEGDKEYLRQVYRNEHGSAPH